MNPPESSSGQAGRILFADDDEAFRLGLGRRLSRAGFACDFAVSGEEAVSLLSTHPYDVLLSDIRMPGNCGLELIEKLPAISEGLPIILLTGNPTVETATRSVGLRVRAYLTKPPDFDELCGLLRSAVAERRGWRTLQDSRRRLQDWDREIEIIQQLLQQAAPSARPNAMHSYLRLTLRNLVVGLVELENLLVHDGPGLGAGEAMGKQDLLKAVCKTISVLERTRDHFKSKELGDLRKELEQLVDGLPGRGGEP